MTRVLVTGAAGLLGSRITRLLLASDCHLLATSRRTPRDVPPGQFRAADLTDRRAVDELLSWARPDIVVHAAALTDVDRCEREPVAAFEANTQASAWLALGCRKAAHMVYVSTDYIFAGRSGLPDETRPPDPLGVYGATKLMAEQAVQGLARSWAVARVCVLFGWPPAGGMNFGSWLVSELAAGRAVRLFRDQHVTPTWVDNAAAMVTELALSGQTGIWHTAGRDSVTRDAFGLALCEVMGYDQGLVIPVTMADARLSTSRPPRAGLATNKAMRHLWAKPLTLAAAMAGFAATIRADAPGASPLSSDP